MLSRKYYKAIAEILNNRFKANPQSEELRFITRELISYFQVDNSRFSEQRFLSAVNQA